MLHIKTFERFNSMTSGPICPVCKSENVDCDLENNCECMTCCHEFVDPYNHLEEDEEDLIEEEPVAPHLTSYEESDYESSSEKIQKIIIRAMETDEELGDQLQFEADQSDSFEDFVKRAVAAIQDVKGVDRDEAIAILNSLQIETDME